MKPLGPVVAELHEGEAHPCFEAICQPYLYPIPDYPALNAGVARFRRKAAQAGGVAAMPKHERQAYGEAVLTAVRANHRAALMPKAGERSVRCASGTAHNTGAAILAAIRRKQGIR
jgi:hypothetical protein